MSARLLYLLFSLFVEPQVRKQKRIFHQVQDARKYYSVNNRKNRTDSGGSRYDLSDDELNVSQQKLVQKLYVPLEHLMTNNITITGLFGGGYLGQ